MPGGVGVHGTLHHHVVVVDLALSAADAAVLRRLETGRIQGLGREVGVAVHGHDVVGVGDHHAIPSRLNGGLSTTPIVVDPAGGGGPADQRLKWALAS